jgi:hypothetical protein
MFNDATDNHVRLEGGYPISSIRTYLNGDLLATLPSDLQTAISEVIKISDGGNERVLKTTNDKIWLLSLEELGIEDQTNQLLGQGEAYSAFTDSSSRIKQTSDGLAGLYMTRSTADRDKYCTIKNDGTPFNYYYYNSSYILFGFCI